MDESTSQTKTFVSDSQPRILVFAQWFGAWPEWMRFFLESCRWNPTIDWLLIGDAPAPAELPGNVRLKQIGFADYRASIAKKLGLAPLWNNAYKLCDFKPVLAAIHEEELDGYDFWGYCDIDVIFGDIRRFYTPEVLAWDVVTTHAHVVGGHFTLLRNKPRMTGAFRKIPFWKRLLSVAEHKSFDERVFSRLFMPFPPRQKWRRLFTPFVGGALMVERYSTNIPPLRWIDGGTDWPEEWCWDRGRLTTCKTGDRQFLYLHFSHWQSNRWTREAVAPWRAIERLDNLPPGRCEHFVIGARGFTSRGEAGSGPGEAAA